MAPDVIQVKATRVLAAVETEAAQVRTVRGLTTSDSGQRVVASLGGNPLVREAVAWTCLSRSSNWIRVWCSNPSLAADAQEIQQRRQLACRNLIDEVLLVDAASSAGSS
jgi:hypothetical protein